LSADNNHVSTSKHISLSVPEAEISANEFFSHIHNIHVFKCYRPLVLNSS